MSVSVLIIALPDATASRNHKPEAQARAQQFPLLALRACVRSMHAEYNPRMTTTVERVLQAVNRQRLLDTAVQLVAVPSRTGEAGAVSDRLAELLADEGF